MAVKGNLLIAQGGGPTPVINCSLTGVVREAKKHNKIDGIFGARFGVEGLLGEDFIDLGKEDEKTIAALYKTPAAALGSCRRKLTDADYPKILRIFKKYDIRYFLYNGGNDSMDTCKRIFDIAGGYDIKVIGIPKTIDNDLVHTDHCPGFGSAARYVAVSAMELARDVESLPIHVCVMEVMGRNAGWLTAAASLAKRSEHEGPHLIYLPENIFNEDKFLDDVKRCHDSIKGVFVVVSEGLKDKDGMPVAQSGITDGFGHIVPGGVSQYLSERIIKRLGLKSRSEKPGLLGRCSIAHQSHIDKDEAYMVGAYAVSCALKGESGYMVSIKRLSDEPYRSEPELVKLEVVANKERKLPAEYMNKEGNGVTEEFKKYALPLLGETLPEHAVMKNVKVEVGGN